LNAKHVCNELETCRELFPSIVLIVMLWRSKSHVRPPPFFASLVNWVEPLGLLRPSAASGVAGAVSTPLLIVPKETEQKMSNADAERNSEFEILYKYAEWFEGLLMKIARRRH
jgi:hypothetical protein